MKLVTRGSVPVFWGGGPTRLLFLKGNVHYKAIHPRLWTPSTSSNSKLSTSNVRFLSSVSSIYIFHSIFQNEALLSIYFYITFTMFLFIATWCDSYYSIVEHLISWNLYELFLTEFVSNMKFWQDVCCWCYISEKWQRMSLITKYFSCMILKHVSFSTKLYLALW